jgi:hypothetical protein
VVKTLSVVSSPPSLRGITLLLEYLAFPLVILALLFVLQLANTGNLHIQTQISATITTYGLGTLLSLFTSGNLDAIHKDARNLLQVTLLIVLLLGIPFSLLALLIPANSPSGSLHTMLLISVAYFISTGLLYVIIRWPRGPLFRPAAMKAPRVPPVADSPREAERPSIN